LTKLMNLFDEMTGLVDEERAVDSVYLDFSKSFDTKSFHTVSHKILEEKLLM